MFECPFVKYPFLIGCSWVRCNKCKGKGCGRRDSMPSSQYNEEKKFQACDKCLGKGGWWAGLDAHREEVSEWFKCQFCLGQGKIKAIIPI